MKKLSFRILLVLSLTICATFFTALTMKASIGTYACWDALSVNISQLTGLKVAHFSIIMNISCVLLQIAVLKKDFQPIRFLQIPYVTLFGMLVNFFYYNVLTFELHHYWIRFLFCIISITGVAFFLGFLTSLNLVTLSVETTCKVISGKFAIDFAALRVGIDVFCIAASILLSLIFGITFTIREGTFIAMFLLGPPENIFMKSIHPAAQRLLDIPHPSPAPQIEKVA